MDWLTGPFSSFAVADGRWLGLLVLLPIIVLLTLRTLSVIGRVRGPLAVGLRCLFVLLLVLALAGFEGVRHTDDQVIVAVIDRSQSVPVERQTEAIEFLREASGGLRPGKDRLAVVSFGGVSSVDQLPAEGLKIERPGPAPRPERTNLGGALRLAMALFPPDTARRVIVFSDGHENVGDALGEGASYAAAGIPIDVAPLRYAHHSEMLVERLSAPPRAMLEETVDLNLIVRSQRSSSARVLLYHNDRLIDLDDSSSEAGFPIVLSAGVNRFTLPAPLRRAGVHQFRAVLVPDNPSDDSIAANNEGRTFTIVGESERVLIVASEDAASRDGPELLAAALRQSGVDCDLVSLSDVSLDLASLSDCSLVILSNVPAYAIGREQQQALAAYVRDLGGGLIVVGGDQSFSMGGYHGTPLEEVLPVMTDRAKLKMLSLGIVLVIDRSGSMFGEKMDAARMSAVASLRLLSRLDRIGVIAFDSIMEWVIPVQPADDKAALEARIARLAAGGGTNMYPPMLEAYQALRQINTHSRHMILLTDGVSIGGDFLGLADRCREANITISAVAIGHDADHSLLTQIATRGGGRMYVASTAQALPRIFARETMLASRSGMYEEAFRPQFSPGASEQILRGFSADEFPPLGGYVISAAKPMANVPLSHARDDGVDPVLAYWQAGLGRSVAFTSGQWRGWGGDWVEWPGFAKLWTQAVRYAARPGHRSEFQLATNIDGERARVVLEAPGLSAAAQRSISLSGQVVRPGFDALPLNLVQTGPGRFEGSFPAGEEGSYIANIAYRYGQGDESVGGNIQTGVSVSYSPETATLTHDETLLSGLARLTGGRMLDVSTPGRSLEASGLSPVETRVSIWSDLVRWALLIFLIDVAVRRLAIDPLAALRRMRAYVAELGGRTSPAASTATTAALRNVRGRLHEEQPELVAARRAAEAAAAAQREKAGATGGSTSSGDDSLFEALDGGQKPAVAAPRRPTVSDTPGEAEYTSRLLRAKRAARKPAGDQGD